MGCRSESDTDQRFGDLWTGPANHILDGRVQQSLLRTFAGLLYVSFIYQASDERDKVFALLVLMNQISISYILEKLPLMADYTRDAAGLYRDVTAWLVSSSGWVTSCGRLEDTAALLLNCPPTVSRTGRTRLDAWISAWMGSRSVSPHSASVRAWFGRWTRSRLRVRLSRANDGGGMSKAFEALRSQLRLVLQLRKEDESGILPTEHELEGRLAGHLLSEKGAASESGPFDPGVQRLEHWGRRLLRIGSVGSPYCPSAVLLGIGPQTCAVGDEVCFVAGSMMPLVVRPVEVDRSNRDLSASRRAYFVGLASVADAIEPSPGQWHRWDIV